MAKHWILFFAVIYMAAALVMAAPYRRQVMEVASNATSTAAPSNGTATASGNATAPAPATTSNGGDLYTPPSGIESAAPGTIVQIIPLNGSLAALSIFPQKLKSVHLIQYRTTDGNGQATTSVTTLIEPYNADPSKLV